MRLEIEATLSDDHSCSEPDESGLAEPLDLTSAQTLVRYILRDGAYVFSKHCCERLAEYEMQQSDVLNVLRCGACVIFNFEKGTYRYQFETPRGYHAVVAFRSARELVVVTAWK